MIGITVSAVVAVLGLATAAGAGAEAASLATRTATASEISAASAAGVAQRWEREPASEVFPGSVKYTTDLQTTERASRLAIGPGHSCSSALDSTLSALASRDGCAAGIRATYADALGGTVYTVGVLAFGSASAAAAFYNRVPVNPFPGSGLRALAVPRTAAARFSDAARQSLSAQQDGPYVVLAVGGYADGRPASKSGERRDAVFDPGDSLVSAIAGPLAAPLPVRCGSAEFTCAVSATPPSSPFGIRSFVMGTLRQISVPQAWNTSKGAGVTVAVLDSGVGEGAPDLQGVVTNGPDYTQGADPPGYQPPHMHGTYISSIIAGRDTLGNQGVIGVAPQSRILSVRVILDDSEPGLAAYESKPAYANAIGEGIYYAARHGAQVINLSLGSSQPTAELRSAVAYAVGKGVVVVASAGNNGSGKGFAPYIYPASFSGVISVAAVGDTGARASFSEQNASVTLSAPGGDWVMGDQPGQSWVAAKGTSPAAALVSGVAALIKSRYPSLSPALVEQAMIDSVTRKPAGGYDVDTGFGEINAAGALAEAGRLAARHPASGLPASARFASSAAPIQVVHRSAGAVIGFGALGAFGLVVAALALGMLVTLARRRPAAGSAVYGFADAGEVAERWQPETWTMEPGRDDDAPAS